VGEDLRRLERAIIKEKVLSIYLQHEPTKSKRTKTRQTKEKPPASYANIIVCVYVCAIERKCTYKAGQRAFSGFDAFLLFLSSQK
jgi:hypothetical protein